MQLDILKNNVLCPFQHGFLGRLSTATNLALLNNFTSNAMDRVNRVDVVYTYYSIAFDKINHDILS